MATLRRILALWVVATYVALAGVACPPRHAPERARSDVHAHEHEHAHAGAEHVMPCHEEPTAGDLRAPCPCGCDESHGAPGSAPYAGPAEILAASSPVLPQGSAEARGARERLPAEPLRRIDHVPLAA